MVLGHTWNLHIDDGILQELELKCWWQYFRLWGGFGDRRPLQL